MTYYQNVTAAIGRTPLVQVQHVCGTNALVLAKLELCNPGGSVKDRAALSIVQAAEASGELQPGGTIVEATSGNTGVGLAMVGAALGYRVVIAMPESMSVERRKLMSHYGAQLLLTPAAGGMAAAVEAAEKYIAANPGCVAARQFSNPANPDAHYRTTAVEILEDTGSRVDVFVAGIGTGGTVSGVGRALKERVPNVRIVGVEPAESPLITAGKAGGHAIQGIGANFIPDNYDASVVDEVLTVPGQEAIEMARLAARQEGFAVGISSGAALVGAGAIAQRPEFAGATIVTLLPDTAERYMSTELFCPVAQA